MPMPGGYRSRCMFAYEWRDMNLEASMMKSGRAFACESIQDYGDYSQQLLSLAFQSPRSSCTPRLALSRVWFINTECQRTIYLNVLRNPDTEAARLRKVQATCSLVAAPPLLDYTYIHTCLTALAHFGTITFPWDLAVAMRLINTTTFELKFFIGSRIPAYAILSHCWGDDEVTLQEFDSSIDKSGPKFEKIRDCCELAMQDGLEWAWVDTCCIDKTSSAELSEAINSMFNWYQRSEVCYAFLDDVPENGNLAECRWFTRGWTLQELLAPKLVRFFDQSRRNVGDKFELSQQLEIVTGVLRQYIRGDASVHEASIAQRMSWAARRVTTREEDTAYSLVGIFDVNMPLLYGEGSKAFTRLQTHIIAQSADESIFCWKAQEPGSPSQNVESPGEEERQIVLQPNPVKDAYVPHVLKDHAGAQGTDDSKRGSILQTYWRIFYRPRSLAKRHITRSGAGSGSSLRGMLAISPREFEHSGHISIRDFCVPRPSYTVSNKGLSFPVISTSIMQRLSSWSTSSSEFSLELQCSYAGRSDRVTISLTRVGGSYYRSYCTRLGVSSFPRSFLETFLLGGYSKFDISLHSPANGGRPMTTTKAKMTMLDALIVFVAYSLVYWAMTQGNATSILFLITTIGGIWTIIALGWRWRLNYFEGANLILGIAIYTAGIKISEASLYWYILILPAIVYLGWLEDLEDVPTWARMLSIEAFPEDGSRPIRRMLQSEMTIQGFSAASAVVMLGALHAVLEWISLALNWIRLK